MAREAMTWHGMSRGHPVSWVCDRTLSLMFDGVMGITEPMIGKGKKAGGAGAAGGAGGGVWAQVGGPKLGPRGWAQAGPKWVGPLGIEVEKQGFQTVRKITGQKFP